MKTLALNKLKLSWFDIVMIGFGLAFLIDFIPDGKINMLAYLLHFIHSSHLLSSVDNSLLINLVKIPLTTNYYLIASNQLFCNYAFLVISFIVLFVLCSTEKYLLASICSLNARIPLLTSFKSNILVIKAFENIP